MSSLARRVQKAILVRRGITPVPVVGRSGSTIGYRLPLCPAHVGYHANGVPVFAAQKSRKPRAKKAVVA